MQRNKLIFKRIKQNFTYWVNWTFILNHFHIIVISLIDYSKVDIENL